MLTQWPNIAHRFPTPKEFSRSGNTCPAKCACSKAGRWQAQMVSCSAIVRCRGTCKTSPCAHSPLPAKCTDPC